MEHPDEGMIRALFDGEGAGGQEGLEAHLADCRRCGAKAEAQANSWETMTNALAVLDVEPPLASARARILEKSRERKTFARWTRRNLPRAASFIVLLTAGTAAALPGSPVRRWVEESWDQLSRGGEPVSPGSATESIEGALPGPGDQPRIVGATLLASSEPISLQIQGLTGGASLRVLLVEGEQAGIFAEEGVRFGTNSGVLTASDPPGEVTVEIPLMATGVTLFVNGRLYLRKTTDGLEVSGPVQTRTPTEIRFDSAGQESEPTGPGG